MVVRRRWNRIEALARLGGAGSSFVRRFIDQGERLGLCRLIARAFKPTGNPGGNVRWPVESP